MPEQNDVEVVEEEVKTFTQEEVDALLLEKQQAFDEEKAQAVKEAKLSVEEREDLQRQKDQAELEALRQEKAITTARSKARETLTSKNLPVSEDVLDLVTSLDEDQFKVNVKKFTNVLSKYKESILSDISSSTSSGTTLKGGDDSPQGGRIDQWISSL